MHVGNRLTAVLVAVHHEPVTMVRDAEFARDPRRLKDERTRERGLGPR